MVGRKNELRTERDQLGEVQIPAGAYWGALTARSCDGLTVSNYLAHPRLLDATILVKKAATLANVDGGRIEQRIGRAVAQAADEIIGGQWRDQFLVDPFQPGAQLALVNNVNEVLANRAAEILGGAAGTYTLVHPLMHVGLWQAPQDVFPSAMRLATLLALKDLEPVLLDMERLLRRKALEFDKIVKVGRPHLQDGLPITLGQEFNAWGSSVERSFRRIMDASQSLLELNVGGTALLSGADIDPAFMARTAEKLSEVSGFRFKPAEDCFRLRQSMGDFVEFSSSLKELAVELLKIASDLRLLSSGPASGIGEIKLPSVMGEPSDISSQQIKQKANPVLAECMNMVAFQVIGNDSIVTMCAQSGQLEGNAMMPLIAHNVLQSLDLLRQCLCLFNKKCIAGISANVERCRQFLEESGALALLLSRHLGRDRTNLLVEESLSTSKSLKALIIEQGLMTADAFEKALLQRPAAWPGNTGATGGEQQ